ncbi:MAG: hypothetical protein IKO16_01755 [Lachnospiraceae bacterium]|nr:hypothetical protein [Lachnospiraceae bacterium]
MSSLSIILISAAVFLALIMWLTVDTDHMDRWTGLAFSVAIAGGLLIYGLINAAFYGSTPVIAVLRTVVNVGQMFGNDGDRGFEKFSAVVGEGYSTSIIYWLIHFFAYYSVVSAVILLLGKGVLSDIRKWLLRIHDIELIFGVNEDTVKLGETLSKNKHVSVVFVGTGNASESAIHKMGALWFSDKDATTPTEKFLKILSVKKRRGRIRISALSPDEDSNLAYSVNMLKLLMDAGVKPERTELVMFGKESLSGNGMLANAERYGYGSVKVYDRDELSARLLLLKYPICDLISFDEEGKATKDVDILLVGFGNIGQEVLRRITALGQFEGSDFRVCVFDPAIGDRDGFFRSRYPALINNYDIKFEPYDGRSSKLVEYLRDNAGCLTEVIVAVGSERTGREIAKGIKDTLSSCGCDVPICQCYQNSVVRLNADSSSTVTSVYDEEVLYGDLMDRLARKINHYYCGDGDEHEQWKTCDYFSRMSCRAGADYLSGILRRVGISDASELTGNVMENLARSEHLRWCAFHYSMGYTAMDEDTLRQRAELIKDDPSIRLTKDTKKRIHACLIPWDELDGLSEFENEVTGKHPDYKQMDRDNVSAVCSLMGEVISRDEPKKGKTKRSFNKRLILPIIVIALIAAVGIGLTIYDYYFGGGNEHVSGYVPAPNSENVSSVDDDISFQEARFMIGDGLTKFAPDLDYTPSESYPLSYDDKNLLPFLKSFYPPTRDQGRYGTCWAHAATALAELSMLSHDFSERDINYSELHLAYSTYHDGTVPTMGDTGDKIVVPENGDTFLFSGGDVAFAAQTLMRRRGMVDESRLPYSDAMDVSLYGIEPWGKISDMAHIRNLILINIRNNPKQVKQAIVENGGVGISYYADKSASYYNRSGNCRFAYDRSEDDADHAVIVIGWDDHFPKDAFNDPAPSDGAWLVRNSWSNESKLSEKSYFWLSYCDPTIRKNAQVLEMIPAAGDYTNLYCYDSALTAENDMNDFINVGANVFRANGSEELGAVTFYAGQLKKKGADYTVSVYTDIPDNASPAKGKPVEDATAYGKIYFDGYYTVELEKSVELDPGQAFAVVVELKGGNLALEMDYDYAGFELRASNHPGESYYKDSSGKWRDVYKVITKQGGINHNLLIGALTRTVGW